METNKKNGSIVAIVILAILVVVLGGYIGYDKFLNKNTVGSTEENSNNKTANVNENQNNNETSSSIKVINFDRKNCINSNLSDENYIVSRFGTSMDVDALSFSINSSNEKIVRIQVRYDIMFPGKYSDDEIRNKEHYDDINLNFDKRVESIFGGLFSADGIDGTVFIFLLEDGSLEYMKYSDIYYSQKYEHKPINGVNEIVRFDNISIRSAKQGAESNYTAIAYKIDGTYYDLSEFIKVY
jgi:hypothetical protein